MVAARCFPLKHYQLELNTAISKLKMIKTFSHPVTAAQIQPWLKKFYNQSYAVNNQNSAKYKKH